MRVNSYEELTFTDQGAGRPILLLHGGAGPDSVAAFAADLARFYRVVTPTHPGFNGTAGPLAGIPELADRYAKLLHDLDLHDVTVVGNSIGGWIAAEVALRSDHVGRLVLVDAVGIEVPGHPVADFFSLTLAQVAEYSYHDPDRFRIDPSALSEAQGAVMAGNRAALQTYGGAGMTDPTLKQRLAGIKAQTLAVWGDSDRIVDPDYGRAYAAAIPGARFALLKDTGHVPQVESPAQLMDVIGGFVNPSTRVAITGPDEGEVAFSKPIRMRILEDGSTTDHRLGIGEITIAPNTPGPAQHRHAQHDEGFYVVRGTATFTVGTESYTAPAGSLVMVPPGAPHTFANDTDEPVVLLNTFTPDLYVQYFRDLGAWVASTGSLPVGEQAAAVMGRYATVPAAEYSGPAEESRP